jgi:hypothetical protein
MKSSNGVEVVRLEQEDFLGEREAAPGNGGFWARPGLIPPAHPVLRCRR